MRKNRIMRIDIEIRKNAVMESVGALSAYLARTLGREDIGIVESNDDVVEQIWLDGITTLSASLQEWSRRLMGFGTLIAPYKGGDFVGTLDMPANYDETTLGTLQASMHAYMVQHIMWRWLQLKAPDAAQTYHESSIAALGSVEVCLTARSRVDAPIIHRRGRRGNVGTIILHRDELLRDIRSRSWVLGDVTPVVEGTGTHPKHLTTDVVTGGNEEITMRDIDLVWHELEDILFPYLAHEDEEDMPVGMRPVGFGPDVFGPPVGGDHGFGGVGKEGYDVMFGPVPHWHRHWPPHDGGKDYGVVDDAMPDQPVYEARLVLPEGVAESTVRYWRTLMHEYIVTQVLANWCALVNIDKHEALALKVAQLREQLAVSLSCRTKRVRRPMRPW